MEKLLLLFFLPLLFNPSEFLTPTLPYPLVDCADALSPAPDTMLLIKGGTFQMGSDDQSDATPIHNVTISKFYLAATETTCAQYCAFLNENGNQTEGGVEWINLSGKYEQENSHLQQYGSRFVVESGYEQHPVIYVSWYGAKAYCDWLTAKSKGQQQYRLPTEAEWEYAAGGGQKKRTKWAGTSDEMQLYRYTNFCDGKCYEYWRKLNQDDGYSYTAPVGQLQSNALGLFDMSGNVQEWCSDRYDADYYQKSPATNPTGSTTGAYRVIRGGGWDSPIYACLINRRDDGMPTDRRANLGFRIAVPPNPVRR